MDIPAEKVLRPSLSRFVFAHILAYSAYLGFGSLVFGLSNDSLSLLTVVSAIILLILLPAIYWRVDSKNVYVELDEKTLSGPLGYITSYTEIIRPKRLSIPLTEIDWDRTSKTVRPYIPFTRFYIWNSKGDSIAIETLFFWPSQINDFLSKLQ